MLGRETAAQVAREMGARAHSLGNVVTNAHRDVRLSDDELHHLAPHESWAWDVLGQRVRGFPAEALTDLDVLESRGLQASPDRPTSAAADGRVI